MNISGRVENILKASYAARNSDKELFIIYMQKSGMNLTEKQIQVFKDMPSFETITRVRRKLQEEGKYEADYEVNEARYNKFKSVRQNAPKSNSSQLEHHLQDGSIILPDGRIVLP